MKINQREVDFCVGQEHLNKSSNTIDKKMKMFMILLGSSIYFPFTY